MTQIRAIWRAAVHGLLAATTFVAMQAQAQSAGGLYYSSPYGGGSYYSGSYGSNYYGGSYYGGGYGGGGYVGGGYTPPIPAPYTPPPPIATLSWSQGAAGAYKLGRVTGTYEEAAVTTTVTSAGGRTTTFRQPIVGLEPFNLSFTGSPGTERPNGAMFRDTITWQMLDVDANTDVNAEGGSFSLSDMKLQQLADGSFRIQGTVGGQSLAGTEVAPAEITAFTVAASQVSWTGHTTTLGALVMTPTMLAHMATGLGLDAEGLQYSTFQRASTNIGSLSITGQVPEPGTWAMWALGLVGLGHVAGRRRRHP